MFDPDPKNGCRTEMFKPKKRVLPRLFLTISYRPRRLETPTKWNQHQLIWSSYLILLNQYHQKKSMANNLRYPVKTNCFALSSLVYIAWRLSLDIKGFPGSELHSQRGCRERPAEHKRGQSASEQPWGLIESWILSPKVLNMCVTNQTSTIELSVI